MLIIDDEAEIRESLQTLLEMEGYTVEAADERQGKVWQRLARASFRLVLLDLALPDRNGMDILSEIRARDPQLPVIMITAYGTVENAVTAMQAGATNFIQKPWDNEKLLADVRAAVGRRRAEEENVQLKRALKQRYNFENIVGKSEPMLQDLRPGRAGGAQPLDRAAAGRKRDGQGADRQSHPHELAAPRPAFVPVNTGSCPPTCWNPRCSGT